MNLRTQFNRKSNTSGNDKLQNALADLISKFGKKKKDDQTSNADTVSVGSKSRNMLIFESAFKKRLANTRIGNKAANEVIIAAMAAEMKAKKEYQKKRRQSIMSRMTSMAPGADD